MSDKRDKSEQSPTARLWSVIDDLQQLRGLDDLDHSQRREIRSVIATLDQLRISLNEDKTDGNE